MRNSTRPQGLYRRRAAPPDSKMITLTTQGSGEFIFSEVLTSRHVKENPVTFLGLAFLFHGRAVLLCPKTWRIGGDNKNMTPITKKNPRKCCKGRKTPTNQTRLVVFVGFYNIRRLLLSNPPPVDIRSTTGTIRIYIPHLLLVKVTDDSRN